jgi:hypothetical protein
VPPLFHFLQVAIELSAGAQAYRQLAQTRRQKRWRQSFVRLTVCVTRNWASWTMEPSQIAWGVPRETFSSASVPFKGRNRVIATTKHSTLAIAFRAIGMGAEG